jgi:hypothetical protein
MKESSIHPTSLVLPVNSRFFILSSSPAFLSLYKIAFLVELVLLLLDALQLFLQTYNDNSYLNRNKKARITNGINH